jgi:hypothetical protein
MAFIPLFGVVDWMAELHPLSACFCSRSLRRISLSFFFALAFIPVL